MINLMEQDDNIKDMPPAQVEGEIETDHESFEFPADDSGFLTEEDYGIIKMQRPSKEGLAASISAADQFATASDGENTDVTLSFHDAFPKDDSGFGKDANSVSESDEGIDVDPNTIPAVNSEDDQFSDHEDMTDTTPSGDVSASDLASDEDYEESLGESFTGWDDLF